MDNLLLHSKKFDGSLHYRYPVELIHRTETSLITYSAPGSPIESHRGSWTGKRHTLSFFWQERPYVLHVVWESPWQPKFLYVDVSTATSWDDKTVRYIDLDLDLILPPDSTAVHLDDQDEFETHQARWNYPESLVKGCWAAVEEVRGLLETRKKPFCPSIFAWRPGTPLTPREI